LNDVLPDIQSAPGDESLIPKEDGAVVKDSVFGEAEVEDITAW
jgi:homoserine O-acetyltransferase